MDLQEYLIKEYEANIEALKDEIAKGNCTSYEEYKYKCGEIKGLKTAFNTIKDPSLTTETEDD